MKKFIMTTLAGTAAVLTLSTANAAVSRIYNYNDLLSALKSGHRVNVVVDDGKCKLTDSTYKNRENNPDISAILGLSFTNNFFLAYKDENDPRHYVGSIATNTIANENGSRQRYKRVRVFDDNTAEVFYSYSETNGKQLGSSTFSCGISTGYDQKGLSIFDYDEI